ncbi:hypothetical protein OB919_06750 [Halobacteria archaeon AArc-curdl1]|uniref:DUF8215 domain-containing protein n=1 Tax=Natronosalvus hydrolyticus TaxID=2979988 RepID=A0AAP2Z7V6_9EURY|nr:hypothetical protein [Halobacteria archaeon AArc-curdl1]
MKRAPGRDTRPAYSDERRTWYGYGTLTRAKKSPWRRFLHDTSTVFADISIFGLPALLLALFFPDASPYGVGATALTLWITMTAVAAVIRGGWIVPLGTEVRGWVSISFWLIVLRILYYNLVITVVVFSAPALARAVGIPALSLLLAVLAGALATYAFPHLGERVYTKFDTTRTHDDEWLPDS